MKVNLKSSMPARSTHICAAVLVVMEEVYDIVPSGQNA